jgi:hypothetical protein
MNALIRSLFNIGASDPYRLVDILLTSDPFQVKVEHPDDAICNTSLTFPSYINETRLELFRSYVPGNYIFYQHLRKAGGTEFCDLVKRNVVRGKANIPVNECQYYWGGALATPRYSNYTQFIEYMTSKRYRVAFNEWDLFFDYFFDYEGAIFVTEFRDPLERWYSQYRFEHLEFRSFPHKEEDKFGMPREPFMYWYSYMPKKLMGVNYYVKTFIGENVSESLTTELGYELRNISDWYWTYRQYTDTVITLDMFERAIKNLSKFTSILILEWINERATMEVLHQLFGWTRIPTKVIPNAKEFHIDHRYARPLAESVTREEYRFVAMENVYDMLLYHICRRMFLNQYKKCPSQ